jgi:hypothetical protein
MKKAILFSILISFFFTSCKLKSDTGLTDQQKDDVRSEIALVIDQLVESTEAVDIEKTLQFFMDSPDFRYVVAGRVFDYASFSEGGRQEWANIEVTKLNPKKTSYIIIDNKTVMVFWEGSDYTKTKTNNQYMADPFTASMLFVNKDGIWKILSYQTSGTSKRIENEPV